MIYFLACVLLALFIVSKSPVLKGKIGEASIRMKLKKLNKKDYGVFHDVMIKLTDGKTSQIDHLVVSRFGVFVIETKNYAGWIIGSEKSEYWTQVIYKRKEKLYNPIRQNYGHIKALESMIGDDTISYISIVAFSTRADLKVELSGSEVVYSTKLVSTILKYKTPLLNEEQVVHLNKILPALTQHTREERKTHVMIIKHNQIRSDKLISEGICPRCNGKLVERRGRNGSFMGCDSYPKCRFTRS